MTWVFKKNRKQLTINKHMFNNPYPAKLDYLNFHPLEVVSRYRGPPLQVAENYSYLFNLWFILCKSWCLNIYFVPNISDLIN